MPKQRLLSFHYQQDNWPVSQIRIMGAASTTRSQASTGEQVVRLLTGAGYATVTWYMESPATIQRSPGWAKSECRSWKRESAALTRVAIITSHRWEHADAEVNAASSAISFRPLARASTICMHNLHC
jgi:hypothetical protein